MSNKKEIFSIRPFQKLKKSLEKSAAQTVAATPPPRQKKKEEYSDEELFASAMGGVQEIEAFRVLSCPQPRPRKADLSVPRSPDHDALAILEAIASGDLPINLSETQEYVEWTNPVYDGAVIAKLHQGHFSVQSYLDLHGCSVSEAEAELDLFLQESFSRGHRCIKIIHGRGLRSIKGPRLKDAVIRRLLGRYRKDLIAYVSARQCDGGLGALYVLLA